MSDAELMKPIFMWSGYALLMTACVIGMLRRPIAFVGLVPALLLFLAANMDRLTSLEISPGSVKADLKEISLKVEDAKSTLAQIQDLAVENAELMIFMREDSKALIADGSVDPAVSDDIFKKRILDSLRKMGLPESRIEEVDKSDRNIVMRNYSYFVFRHALTQLPVDKHEKFEADYGALEAKAIEGPITVQDMQGLFSPYQIDLSRFQEFWEDYEYYQKATVQRRPEIWAKRSSWGYPENISNNNSK